MHRSFVFVSAVSCLVLGTALGIGCDSDDKDTPPDQCRKLVDTICRRDGQCTTTAVDAQTCRSDGAEALGCARARGVSDTFNQCVKDLGALSCPSLFPGGELNPPATCVGALDIMPTPEEQKCLDLNSTVCRRLVECTMSTMPMQEQMECEAFLAQQVSCEETVQVGATYDACLMHISTATCPVLFPMDRLSLPMDCQGVIVTGAPGGGSGGAGGSTGSRGVGLGGSGGTKLADARRGPPLDDLARDLAGATTVDPDRRNFRSRAFRR